MALKAAPRVYADDREYESDVPRLLSRRGIIVFRRRLDVADYLVSENVAVERKEARDFVRSVYDGRLFEQARRLGETYATPILIVEGDLDEVFGDKRRRAQMLAALLSVALEHGLLVIYTGSREETADAIAWMARRLQGGGGVRMVVHRKPRLSTIREWQLYLVQGLPYVGPKTAERLLEKFGTPQAVFNAGFSELSRIEGIGERKATLILRILRTPYGRERRERGLGEYWS